MALSKEGEKELNTQKIIAYNCYVLFCMCMEVYIYVHICGMHRCTQVCMPMCVHAC